MKHYASRLGISDAGTGRGGGQGGYLPPPQYLVDQLTLFQMGRADYPHLMPPPQVFHLPASLNIIEFCVLNEEFPFSTYSNQYATSLNTQTYDSQHWSNEWQHE